MKTILSLIIMLTGSLLLISCDKNELSHSGFDNSVITKVEGPASGSVGQEIDLEITLQGYNGCAVAGQLQESIYGNTRVIKGKVIYEGEACHQALVSVVKSYMFKTSSAGTYELKFLKVDNTFITHTITVIN